MKTLVWHKAKQKGYLALAGTYRHIATYKNDELEGFHLSFENKKDLKDQQ